MTRQKYDDGFGFLLKYDQDGSKDTCLTDLSIIRKLGDFDFDPCGYKGHPTAKKVISLPLDGLKEKWKGRVWLNPPYSEIEPWLQKMSKHGNGVALVLNSTDTRWFHAFGVNKAQGMFLMRSRPKFIKPDGTKITITRGVILFSYGEESTLRLKNSGILGRFLSLK